VLFGTDTGSLQTYEFTGKKLWAQQIDGKLYSKPVVLDDKIVLGIVGGTNLVASYNTNGSEIWHFAIPK
jgi:outer membrane protein assembly factor BamB